jgi:hypothetical protein
MEPSDLEARLARLESRVNANPAVRYSDAVERSINAFAEQRTVANAHALLDEIDRAEPDPDEGVMSGPTVTVTVTISISITITIKAKDSDDPDDPETDPEDDPE